MTKVISNSIFHITFLKIFLINNKYRSRYDFYDKIFPLLFDRILRKHSVIPGILKKKIFTIETKKNCVGRNVYKKCEKLRIHPF